MKKNLLVLGLTLFTSGLFANNLCVEETTLNENGSTYGCTTTVWYRNYGTPRSISFYHDDCSGQACCNDYLKSDISLIKLHYAVREEDQGQEAIYVPALELENDGGIIERFDPEQP